jgi:hypothetical protein
MEENKLAPALLISSKICFKSSNPKFPQEAKELLSPIITDEDNQMLTATQTMEEIKNKSPSLECLHSSSKPIGMWYTVTV